MTQRIIFLLEKTTTKKAFSAMKRLLKLFIIKFMTLD